MITKVLVFVEMENYPTELISILEKLQFDVNLYSSLEKLEYGLSRKGVNFVIIDGFTPNESKVSRSVMELLRKKDIPFLIISDSINKSNLLEVADFMPQCILFRPYDIKALLANVNLAIAKQSMLARKKYLTVFKNRKVMVIKVDSVIAVEARPVNLKMYDIENNEYNFKATLSDFCNEYGDEFSQIHRSYGINRRHILSISNSVVRTMIGDFPRGRKFK